MKSFLFLLLLFCGLISRAQSWEQLNDSIIHYYNNSDYTKALSFGKKTLEAAEKEYGTNHLNYATTLFNLAVVSKSGNDYPSSEKYYLQSLAIRKKILERSHPDFIITAEGLANLYSRMKEYVKAEALRTELLQIQMEGKGEASREYAMALNQLAIVHQYMGQNEKAIGEFANSLSIFKKLAKNEDLVESVTSNLAYIYYNTGDLVNAEKYFIELAEVQAELYGETSVEYVNTLEETAVVYAKLKKYEKAVELRKMAATYFLQKSGKESPDYARRLNQLAILYQTMNEVRISEQYYVQAIDQLRISGKDDELLATIIENIAGLYEESNQLNEAIGSYRESMLLAKKIYGSADTRVTIKMNNLAFLLVSVARYKEAEEVYLETLAIKRNSTGVNNLSYAGTLSNLAALYDEIDQFEKAEKLYLEALAIKKELAGENSSDYALSLNNLGLLYQHMAQYEKAEIMHLQALLISEKDPGKNTEQYEAVLNNLAVLYENDGHLMKADSLYKEVLASIKARGAEKKSAYARALNNLAYFNSNTGNYSEAERLYLQAAIIWKTVYGEEHPSYAIGLGNMATLYRRSGDYARSEASFLKVLSITKKLSGEESLQYASDLSALAGLYKDMGQYAKAEPLYTKALAIRKKTLTENHPDYAATLNNIGALYEELGQLDKALELYLQSFSIREKILGRQHPEFLASMINLAVLYKRQSEYGKAGPLYEEALELSKKIYSEKHPDHALVLNNVAAFYQSIKNFIKAEALYLDALRSRESIYGTDHPLYASTLNNLAVVYKETKRYSEAEELYKKAIAAYKKSFGDKHVEYALSLTNLSLVYVEMGRIKEAEQLISESSAIDIQNLLTSFTTLSEKEKGNYVNANLDLNHYNNSFLYTYRGSSDNFYKENYNLQLLLKSLALSDTKNAMEAVRTSSDSGIQKLFSEWQAMKSLLAKQYALPVNERVKTIKQVEDKAELTEKELNRRSVEFRSQQTALQIKLTDVQSKLFDNEAAIEFVRFDLFDKRWTDTTLYAAYILRKDNAVPIFVPLCEERMLQKLFDSAGLTATSMVTNFYRGLELKNKNAGKLGRELYNLVWLPLEKHLLGIKKVSYSPAGKLYSIAFHALAADSAVLLMDKYNLQQTTSTREIALREPEVKAGPGPITLFGNASFTIDSAGLAKKKIESGGSITGSAYTPQTRSSDKTAWSNLEGTAIEVGKIKELFDKNQIKTQLFTKAFASEENLKNQHDHSSKVLHIATHGFFLPSPGEEKKNEGTTNTYSLAEDPLMRSGLILAGANYAWSGKTPIEGIEDGIATAYEISQLNLRNTELVVLSACETALGDVQGSEGVFGLQRAFKMAGVKKMIVSLWQVPDKETAELMVAFYSYWMKGKTINEAFTQAQTDMRKKYSPFYWAAFVLVE